MNTLHLTQQFAGASLFFYGYVTKLVSKTKKEKNIGVFLIFLSIFIHLSILLFVPFVFLKKIKFNVWTLLIIGIIVLIFSQMNVLKIFIYLVSHFSKSSILYKGIYQKISSVAIEGDNPADVLSVVAFIESGLMVILGLLFYNKFTYPLKNLFVLFITCYIFIILFRHYPILGLRYYVDFEILKMFFYSFFFFKFKPVVKQFRLIGYIGLLYFIFSFFTSFTHAPFSFQGIHGLNILSLNLPEIINNIK